MSYFFSIFFLYDVYVRLIFCWVPGRGGITLGGGKSRVKRLNRRVDRMVP